MLHLIYPCFDDYQYFHNFPLHKILRQIVPWSAESFFIFINTLFKHLNKVSQARKS